MNVFVIWLLLWTAVLVFIITASDDDPGAFQ